VIITPSSMRHYRHTDEVAQAAAVSANLFVDLGMSRASPQATAQRPLTRRRHALLVFLFEVEELFNLDSVEILVPDHCFWRRTRGVSPSTSGSDGRPH
jgi:hypothetical protein